MDLNEIRYQIASWERTQLDYVEAREAYRKAHAEAVVASSAKNEAARKAEADSVTSELRLRRDTAEAKAAAEWQLLLAMRGRLESSAQPGQHWGEGA